MLTLNLPKKPMYIKLEEVGDCYELFQKIEQECDNCFFLESLGEQEHMSRYSIIGFEPEHIIRGKEKMIYIDKEKYQVKNPYDELKNIIPQDAIARNYAGGLVGFLGYDAMTYFEPSLNITLHPLFDQFIFGVFTDGIIFDKVTGELTYFYYDENRISFVQEIRKTILTKKQVHINNMKDSLTKEQHRKLVLQAKEEIRAGNTFQCQIGFKKEFEITGDAIVLYGRLRKINPSPFMYYVKFGDKKIIGASPELLFGMRDKEMSSFPLAGTIKRGKTKQEDQQLAKILLNDPKEIAEHTMLVDLHRNDIGKVAQFGSVKVRNLLDIKRFSHVQHISSEIVGLVHPKDDMFSSLASNFPAGTLSGAPKIESMKIIERLEKNPRGPYGGAVGHFGFNGDCTFAIPIRTIYIAGNYGYTQASGGIVYDSDPDKEYEEIKNKMKAVSEVLGVRG